MTDQERAVLKQALEALEQARDTTHSDTLYAQFEVAITALRAALAQQEQAEPVAWRYKGMMGMPWSLSDDGYYVSCKRDKGYTVEPLYTHPPRREWHSLTDADFDSICDNHSTLQGAARAIEAALKGKNA
jgi:hypothetical protein